jgi:hypothetical protein
MSEQWQEHEHQALAHNHRHFHVTHNWKDGAFEHLSAEHDHEHDHAPLNHAHFAHEDFEAEHHGEAHIHDHEQAVRPETARKAAGTKKAPAKTAKTGGDGEGQTTRGRRTTKATR